MKKANPRRTRSRRGLRVLAITGALLGVLASVGVATPALAYVHTGCHWNTRTLRIDYRYVNGNFRTAMTSAKNNYNSATVLSLSLVDTSGPSFSAANSNYGATGYEGYTTWNCLGTVTTGAHSTLNQYYLSGSEPLTQLKVVWAHEMGHGLGLDHVTGIHHVMYPSASAAYGDGVTGLTTDEVNGINSMY